MTDRQDEQARLERLSRDRYERPLPKRFYTTVSVSDDHRILLDGRPVRTPMKALLQLPNRAIANAVAAEWDAQVSVINPGSMPITKYANTAIDRAGPERDKVISELADYAGSDLVCYRADRPPDLVALQNQHWNPVLEWAEARFGPGLRIAVGLTHVAQPSHILARVSSAAEICDAYQLTILYNLTTLTGSVLLALMLVEGVGSSEQVWAAAHVDEDYQISNWGEDIEASKRRHARQIDFDGLVAIFGMLRS